MLASSSSEYRATVSSAAHDSARGRRTRGAAGHGAAPTSSSTDPPSPPGRRTRAQPVAPANYFMESPREGERLEAKTNLAVAARQLRWGGLRAGMRALDVGCGTGAVARVMAAIAVPAHVTAFDASAARIEQGRELAARAGLDLEFVRGDALALPFADGSFDFTWSRFLFEYLARPQQALSEMVRVTRPGGVVVLGDLDGQLDQIYPLDPRIAADLGEGIRLLEESGFDKVVGRKLYGWLHQAGLEKLAVKVQPYHVYAGKLPGRDQRNWTEKLTTATARLGELTGDRKRWNRFRDAYLAQLQRPGGFYYCSLVLARGQVPTL